MINQNQFTLGALGGWGRRGLRGCEERMQLRFTQSSGGAEDAGLLLLAKSGDLVGVEGDGT